LHGEVQGQFDAVLLRRRAQAAEALDAAKLRVHRLVAAFLGADGVGAARVPGAALRLLLRPLRWLRPIGWIGGR